MDIQMFCKIGKQVVFQSKLKLGKHFFKREKKNPNCASKSKCLVEKQTLEMDQFFFPCFLCMVIFCKKIPNTFGWFVWQ